MNYIIIFAMIGVFFLGFIFIDKICTIIIPADSILEIPGKSNIQSISRNALIFGKSGISNDLEKLLKSYNIYCNVITDIVELNKSDSYYYLFAVDNVDLENLMICSIGKKMMGINKIISLCNCPYNKKIFEDNHITFLCGENIAASQFITAAMISSSKNVGGFKDVYN